MPKEQEQSKPEVGCPFDPSLKFLATEWTSHIIWTLGRQGDLRFGALRRALPGEVSARVLSARLKQLAAAGLIHRQDISAVPPHVIYSLTERGRQADALLNKVERLSNRI